MSVSDGVERRVVMVKKVLASGQPCAKCGQAEELLRKRKLWDQVTHVAIADERDPASEGMQLAKRHGIELAPFFLVEQGEKIEILTSVIKLAKALEEHASSVPQAQTTAEQHGAGRLEPGEMDALAAQLSGAPPQQIVETVLKRLSANLKFAFSGAEDVVLIDMAARTGLPFSVFCLDTGRLHPETYRFIEKVRTHYGIEIDLLSPDYVQVEALVRNKGLFSFYQDGHAECCGIRKVVSLRRFLTNAAGWVTGQRRDQSPTRSNVPEILWDDSHVAGGLLKVNPLAQSSLSDVWSYIAAHGVPYNELHERGYISIGCEPCTRPIKPGQHERSGRFWWEDATRRECGLHSGQ